MNMACVVTRGEITFRNKSGTTTCQPFTKKHFQFLVDVESTEKRQTGGCRLNNNEEVEVAIRECLTG